MTRGPLRTSTLVVSVLTLLGAQLAVGDPQRRGGAASLRVVVVKGVAEELEARGEVVSREENGRLPEVRASFVVPSGRASVEVPLRLPGAGTWWIGAEGPGLFSKPQRVALPGGTGRLSLEVRPLVRLTGRIAGRPERATEAESALVRWRAPESLDPWESRKAVVSAGHLEAEVPAGTWDLAIQVTGCASDRRESVPVPAGAPKELGAVSAVPGASLVGRVALSGTDAPRLRAATRVTLSPVGEVRRQGAAGEEISLSRESRLSPSGELQFIGLAAGRYLLRVHTPGFAREDRSVDLAPDVELELRDPISLARPARLQVDLSPPLDPAGSPWEVDLREAGEAGLLPDSMRAVRSSNGVALFPDIRLGGEYLAIVRARSGDAFRVESVTVDAPVTKIRLRLDAVAVVGRVTLGDEPLAAEVIFGGRNAAPSVRSKSGEDGEFRVELPRAGAWPVEVLSRAPRISRIVRVTVPEMEGGVPSRVDLAVPLTRLRVRILDEDGAAVASCLVRLESMETHENLSEIARDGEAELTGLTVGEWIVHAESARAVSESKAVTIEKDGGAETTLTLAEKRTVRGVVVSSLGDPVPYARLQPLRWDSRADLFPQTVVADAAGRFQLQVPPKTERVGFLVLPPGRPMTTAVVPVGGAGESVVSVPEEGGPVRFSFGAGADAFPAMPWITDGTLTFPAVLLRLSSEVGMETRAGRTWVEVPSYRAGPFGVCASARLGTSDLDAIGLGCVAGGVAPGRELALDLESPKP